MAKLPPPKVKPSRPAGSMRLLGIIALIAAVLLAAAIGLLIVRALTKSNAPLPAGPATVVPVPQGLPEVRQPNLPQAALPETQVPSIPQAPVTKIETPAAPPPEASGTVTWRWMCYPVSPSILGVQIQSQMPGYQFVALGVTVYNQSSENVPVDNNAFWLNVDGRIYHSDQFSTADAVINGLPFLTAMTLAPGGTVGGQTAFMIPATYGRIAANWNLSLPKGVKVVRVDPVTPVQQPRQAPPAAQPRPSTEE
jgi:hypothetical protein